MLAIWKKEHNGADTGYCCGTDPESCPTARLIEAVEVADLDLEWHTDKDRMFAKLAGERA